MTFFQRDLTVSPVGGWQTGALKNAPSGVEETGENMDSKTSGAISRPVIMALGVYALAGLLSPAHAQVVTSKTAAPAAAGPVMVEQIIVTARRRNESVQNTPVSVSAVSPTQLANIAAPDIRDLAGRVPGLVIDPVSAGPSAAAISIRGISFQDIEKSFDPAVGVLIDDVYIGTNTGQLTDTFDLQSVEVLRGPQGTLFGRNTIGGVISVQRTRPTGVLGGKFNAILGDYGRQEYHGVLNLPKIGDQLSTKLFVSSRKSDGYVQNATLNRSDTDRTDILRYGVTFLWQPTSNFDANLTLEQARETSGNDTAPLSSSTDLICLRALPAPLNGPPFESPDAECIRTQGGLYTTFSNKAGLAHNREDDATLQANWRLDGVTLTSITGFRQNKESVSEDFDSSSVNFFDTVRNQKFHQFSEELRASGNFTPAIDYVVGAYYFKSHYSLDQFTNYGLLLQAAAGLPARGEQLVSHDSQSYAGFGDVNWQFAPDWRLTLGGRYTTDKKSLFNNFPGAFTASGSKSWSEFTPKASVDYKPNEDVLLYASYSVGYRSGGFNGRSATPLATTTPYNPERVNSFELGAKTQWFERRLVANVAAFYNDYQDKQEEVVVPVSGGANAQQTLVVNAATAKIYGVEFDLSATPAEHLTLRANLALTHSQYDRFAQADPSNTMLTDDLSNLTLRRAPKVTGGVGFDYDVPTDFGDLSFTADYRYVGKYATVLASAAGTGRYFDTTTRLACGTPSATCVFVPAVNDPRGTASAANTVDISARWRRELGSGRLSVTAFGRNVTDDRGLSGGLAVAGLFTFGAGRPPRTWGVELGYEF